MTFGFSALHAFVLEYGPASDLAVELGSELVQLRVAIEHRHIS
jgi:hypothetical protein